MGSSNFQLSRLCSYFKLEVMRNKKGLMLALVLPFAISFFMGLLLVIIVEQTVVYEHHENYAFILIIGGFIITSMAFTDLGKPFAKAQYLTLPVSTLEKFVGMWFMTSICWIVLLTLLYGVYGEIANMIGSYLFSSVQFESFNPFHRTVISSIAYYFVLQGIFLIGATHFEKYVFAKLAVVFVLLFLVLVFLLYLFLGDLINTCLENMNGPMNEEMNSYKLFKVAKWLFWWILAPLSWVIAYYGLKDKEA